MSYPEIGRRCAICGHAATPRRGGLGGFAATIDLMKKAGAALKLPDSRYAHVRCVNRRKATR